MRGRKAKVVRECKRETESYWRVLRGVCPFTLMSSSSFAKLCSQQLKTKVKTPLQRCYGLKARRCAAVVLCALYVIVSRKFIKPRKEVVITAILPTTARQLDFTRASLLTCRDVLTPENGIRDLIYVVPRQDIRIFESQLPQTRVNSRIVPEDDFVPELSGRPWPGAHKQQIIKLLSYRQTSSTHILFLDSDSMCSPKWTQQRLSKQNFVRSFVAHSWFGKPLSQLFDHRIVLFGLAKEK